MYFVILEPGNDVTVFKVFSLLLNVNGQHDGCADFNFWFGSISKEQDIVLWNFVWRYITNINVHHAELLFVSQQ